MFYVIPGFMTIRTSLSVSSIHGQVVCLPKCWIQVARAISCKELAWMEVLSCLVTSSEMHAGDDAFKIMVPESHGLANPEFIDPCRKGQPNWSLFGSHDALNPRPTHLPSVLDTVNKAVAQIVPNPSSSCLFAKPNGLVNEANPEAYTI